MQGDSRLMEEPYIFRSDGEVKILVEAAMAQSLYQAIKAAGLIVALPAEPDHDGLTEDFGVEPKEGQQCLVISDPDHLIADVVGRWRRQRN